MGSVTSSNWCIFAIFTLALVYLIVLLQVTSIDLGPDRAYTGSVDDIIRVWDLRKENSVVYEVSDDWRYI